MPYKWEAVKNKYMPKVKIGELPSRKIMTAQANKSESTFWKTDG